MGEFAPATGSLLNSSDGQGRFRWNRALVTPALDQLVIVDGLSLRFFINLGFW